MKWYTAIPGMYHLCISLKGTSPSPINDQKGKPEKHRLQTYRLGEDMQSFPERDGIPVRIDSLPVSNADRIRVGAVHLSLFFSQFHHLSWRYNPFEKI